MPLSSYLCTSSQQSPVFLANFISHPSVSHFICIYICSYISLSVSLSCWTLQSVGMALWSRGKSVIVDPRWWVSTWTSCMKPGSLTFCRWVAPPVALWASEGVLFAGTELKVCFHVRGCRSVLVVEEPAAKNAPLPMMPCAVMDCAAVAARWVQLLYNNESKKVNKIYI